MAFALVGAVGAVSTGTAGAAVTPAYGAGSSRIANNLLILHVATTGSATLPAAPAGWSIAKQQAGTSCSASIFYKLAAGADAAPTVALVTSAIHNARLSEFSGGVTATPLDQTAGVAGITTPLVATAGAADVGVGDLVIGCGGAINSAARANTMTHTINNGVVDTETSNGATSTVSHYDFTYGTTTGKAAADSDSFAFVTTQLTGAVLTLASFKVPTVVFTDSGSGTVTVGGSGVESYSTPTVYDGVIDVDGPLSHWKLGNPTTAVDRKGVFNIPAVNGPIAAVTGLLTINNLTDRASRFGADQFFFQNVLSVYPAAAWSMEFWFVTRAALNARLVQRNTATGSRITLSSNGSLQISENDATSTFQFATTAADLITIGQTYHVVGTFDGSVLRLYVNGVLVASTPCVGNTGDTSAPQIGDNSSTNDYDIDEVAWYSTALPPARVLAHYQAGSPGTAYNDSRSGTVTASGSGTESSTHINSGSGTVIASGTSVESAAYGDNATITTSGLYDATVDVDTPVSHWKLGESGQATDRKGVRNLLAVSNPPTAESLVANNGSDAANSFDGARSPAIAQRFSVPSAAGVGTPYNTSTWSAELWIKPSSLVGDPDVFFRTATAYVWISASSGDFIVSFGETITTIPSKARVGRLAHLVLTFDGATGRAYLDGQFAATKAGSVTVGNSAPIIGARAESGAINGAFRGTIDEVSWYNTELSLARVQAHYRAGLRYEIGSSGTSTESATYTDSQTCIATVSGSGVENYVLSGDTTAPIPTVTIVDVTKISRVVGKDVVNVTFTADEAFVEYEIRRVSSGSDSQAAGNQVETSSVSSRTSHSIAITDDELIAASAIEGSNTLKIFVKDVAGNWST